MSASTTGKNQAIPVLNQVVIAAAHESAFGAKRTFQSRSAMSAFGGKADIAQTSLNVCFLPKADIGSGFQQHIGSCGLFDLDQTKTLQCSNFYASRVRFGMKRKCRSRGWCPLSGVEHYHCP